MPQHYSLNRSLGKWVAKQREQFRFHTEGKHSFLTEERIDLLKSVGFVWQIKGRGAKRALKDAKDAKTREGDMDDEEPPMSRYKRDPVSDRPLALPSVTKDEGKKNSGPGGNSKAAKSEDPPVPALPDAAAPIIPQLSVPSLPSISAAQQQQQQQQLFQSHMEMAAAQSGFGPYSQAFGGGHSGNTQLAQMLGGFGGGGGGGPGGPHHGRSPHGAAAGLQQLAQAHYGLGGLGGGSQHHPGVGMLAQSNPSLMAAMMRQEELARQGGGGGAGGGPGEGPGGLPSEPKTFI